MGHRRCHQHCWRPWLGYVPYFTTQFSYLITHIVPAAINVSLAFCMGTDLDSIVNSDQPMAQIFFNSFGQKGTLALWAVIVMVQYMMGSSMVRFSCTS